MLTFYVNRAGKNLPAGGSRCSEKQRRFFTSESWQPRRKSSFTRCQLRVSSSVLTLKDQYLRPDTPIHDDFEIRAVL